MIELPASLPAEAAAYIGPRLSYSNRIPTAATHIDSHGRVRIEVNPNVWATLDDHARTQLLVHELLHVLRGDLEFAGDLRANYAQDMLINRLIDHQAIENQLDGQVPLWTEVIAEQLGLPFKPAPGWKTIYERLPEIKAHEFCALSAEGQVDDLEVIEAASAVEKATEGRVKVTADRGAGRGTHRGPLVDIPAYKPSTLRRLLNAIEHTWHSTRRIPRRTWRREGRTPWLRGTQPMPTVNILVAVDCSGSMSGILPELAAVARVPGIQAQWCAFNDEIVGQWSDPPRRIPDAGGGTAFGPVTELAQRIKPDVLVMVTDGYPFDRPSAPRCPTIWVMPPNAPVVWPGRVVTAS
jgi:predicted metal-dependent peptidase